MHQDSIPTLLFLLVALSILLGFKSIRALGQQLAEGMSNFRNGGGSGSPPHPIPGNDSRILNRKIRKRDRSEVQ